MSKVCEQASMADRDPEALLREVHHSKRHLLCPGCRDRYLANPPNLPLPKADDSWRLTAPTPSPRQGPPSAGATVCGFL